MTHKFYPGTDFQTRYRRGVIIYAVTDLCIHGCIEDETYPRWWCLDGSDPTRREHRDLIPKPRTVTLQEYWIDYSPTGLIAGVHVDQEDADEYKPKGGFIRHIPTEEREVE